MSTPYTIIIGLEVHVQLATQSKLFCRCSTQYGAEPNTQTCPVCTGTPGALPVMNREAFALSMRTALALDCEIPKFTKWDRKQYYYPDLPKGYQISQYDLPMSQNGGLNISDPKDRFEPKRVGIIRAHLEEDAGKSMHDEVAGQADSRIDLNRTGTPLLEIVSEPDMRSPEEAKAYLTELKLLLTYLDVSDCNMQEGSLRVDGNINLHIDTPQGKIATPIVEVKNMNSFRAVERAMAYEAERQYAVWKEDGKVIGDAPKQTRGWDDAAGLTRGQRHKEESSDYRYLPDPDLAPVIVTQEEIDQVKANLGERPAALRERLVEDHGISAYDSDVIVNQGRALADFFLSLVKITGDGKLASNWIQQDVLRYLSEKQLEIADYPVSVETLGELIGRVAKGELPTSRGREVLGQLVEGGGSVDAAMQALGIEQVDEGAEEELCKTLLEGNPQIVADIKEGKLKAAGSLIGLAKKQNPNVNPQRIRELCIELAQQM